MNEVENPVSNYDFGSNLLSSGGSQLKEYAINILLTFIFGGKNQGLISTISVVFADYDIRDILKPFKDEPNCMSHMPKMVDSVLEALSRYIAGSAMGVDRNNYGLNLGGITSSFAGNMFGEVIRDSNMGETISNKLCKLIH